jgi:hypothetical protein
MVLTIYSGCVSLNNINQLGFVAEPQCTLHKTGNEFLYAVSGLILCFEGLRGLNALLLLKLFMEFVKD